MGVTQCEPNLMLKKTEQRVSARRPVFYVMNVFTTVKIIPYKSQQIAEIKCKSKYTIKIT